MMLKYYSPQSKDKDEGRQRCHQSGKRLFSAAHQQDGGQWGSSSLYRRLVWHTLWLHARGLPLATDPFPYLPTSQNSEGGSASHGHGTHEQGTCFGRPPRARFLSPVADVPHPPSPLSPVLYLDLSSALFLLPSSESCLRETSELWLRPARRSDRYTINPIYSITLLFNQLQRLYPMFYFCLLYFHRVMTFPEARDARKQTIVASLVISCFWLTVS